MASRRSRRMTRGSGGVQEQLAALAGIQKLMGDPLQELAGLMQLQQMSDASVQGKRAEERAVRNEAFVRGQAELKQENADLDRKQRFGIAKAAHAQQAAVNKLAEKRGTRQEGVAAATLKVTQEKLKLLQDEATQRAEAKLPNELTNLFRMLAGFTQSGMDPSDPTFAGTLKTLHESMRFHGFLPEDTSSRGESPETLEEVRDTLNAPPPTQGSSGDPPRGFYGHPGGGRP